MKRDAVQPWLAKPLSKGWWWLVYWNGEEYKYSTHQIKLGFLDSMIETELYIYDEQDSIWLELKEYLKLRKALKGKWQKAIVPIPHK